VSGLLQVRLVDSGEPVLTQPRVERLLSLPQRVDVGMIGGSPQFAGTYAAIAGRRGKKIATTAISCKLLTRGYHLLAAHAAGTPATTTHASEAG